MIHGLDVSFTFSVKVKGEFCVMNANTSLTLLTSPFCKGRAGLGLRAFDQQHV